MSKKELIGMLVLVGIFAVLIVLLVMTFQPVVPGGGGTFFDN